MFRRQRSEHEKIAEELRHRLSVQTEGPGENADRQIREALTGSVRRQQGWFSSTIVRLSLIPVSLLAVFLIISVLYIFSHRRQSIAGQQNCSLHQTGPSGNLQLLDNALILSSGDRVFIEGMDSRLMLRGPALLLHEIDDRGCTEWIELRSGVLLFVHNTHTDGKTPGLLIKTGRYEYRRTGTEARFTVTTTAEILQVLEGSFTIKGKGIAGMQIVSGERLSASLNEVPVLTKMNHKEMNELKNQLEEYLSKRNEKNNRMEKIGYGEKMVTVHLVSGRIEKGYVRLEGEKVLLFTEDGRTITLNKLEISGMDQE